MTFSADEMQPNPAKIEALSFIKTLTDNVDLISFLYMMQSNVDFILNFAPLRELTHQTTHFKWRPIHQKCFESLIQDFKKDTLLQYFDMRKKIFAITDAHITSLGAILTQVDDCESARPVIIASRTTSKAESRYPQLHLEPTATAFAPCRFQNYFVIALQVFITTDHKPLCPIFNSLQTDRIKLHHQDMNYKVQYQQGKANQSDYSS